MYYKIKTKIKSNNENKKLNITKKRIKHKLKTEIKNS